MSRQLDRSRAIMLFADRVLPGSITLVAPSRSVLDSDVEERILDLVEALGMRFLSYSGVPNIGDIGCLEE